jgi:hypothetical protein
MTRKLLGDVVKYCPKANVAILDLYEMLEVGDQIMIENKDRSFDQQIISMEIEHEQVKKCEKGLAAIKIDEKVRVNDKIYKVSKIDRSSFVRDMI